MSKFADDGDPATVEELSAEKTSHKRKRLHDSRSDGMNSLIVVDLNGHGSGLSLEAAKANLRLAKINPSDRIFGLHVKGPVTDDDPADKHDVYLYGE
ncbi:MAG: hypothetical protein K9W43_07685 [Candidatus Thorarchaeota archaeon]|nr:hypothetical protein [Candidatus Thorarchaeota archaeon]